MSLNKLVPEDHPKRIILDKLPWNELVKIARRAYQSDHWKDMPNARVMVGLYVWDCISKDKPYRDIEEDFSFNVICAYACGFKEVETRIIHHTALIKFEEHLGVENILEIKDIIEKFLVNDLIKEFQKEVNQDHRHYDRVARAEYLAFAKKRKIGQKEIKKIKKKQLQFLKRNLQQAKEIITALKKETDKKEIQLKGKDRIVSFHRPNVRPIFRGKAKKKTEFGVKICSTIVGKALVLGKMDYNNFYDGKGLTETILEIKNKGYPIKEIIGDKGNGGMCGFLKENEIVDGIEKRKKRKKDPPIPKKRFVSARNRKVGRFHKNCLLGGRESNPNYLDQNQASYR